MFSGIDMGGLFKDFWTDLSARVFDPSFGLFSITSSQVCFLHIIMNHQFADHFC
jgi:hypothetical protein